MYIYNIIIMLVLIPSLVLLFIPCIDVAISAPFTETGKTETGTVYVYHSSPTLLLSNEPQQVCKY